MFWTCWGLGSPEAIRALLDLIRLNSPHAIVLCETRTWDSEMDSNRSKLSFSNGVWVGADG